MRRGRVRPSGRAHRVSVGRRAEPPGRARRGGQRIIHATTDTRRDSGSAPGSAPARERHPAPSPRWAAAG
ncbi:hypothetical protein SCATT_p12700 (plasmid) [Streptantibioticus cattleyicolor NRRL 8057 = DSM 46488]|uniref:Uncharacterized protein n=1 Tax=Streptantibioticus cattleyicolor (strain ATCC 35852 / DSM 46488 / JCM 4925 / NBRC 14057 / NRRL 8057) TaxID=1003195 RepID=G8XFC0_STREN|nr:hypothetical protein SCATT_p12700 [Streptantibioticus cattleyicolor NRRL 8057 = DSM 46488]